MTEPDRATWQERQAARYRAERSKPQQATRRFVRPQHAPIWQGKCPAFRPIDERDERRGRMARVGD